MPGKRVWLYLILAGVCAGIVGLSPRPCCASAMKTAYLRINAGGYVEFAAAIRNAEKQGAVLHHRFYPYAAIGKIPEGSERIIDAVPGVQDVFVERVLPEMTTSMSPHERHVLEAYNNVFFPLRAAASSAGSVEDEIERDEDELVIDPGPLRIPEEYLEELSGAAGLAGHIAAPPPTSEFFLGHVAVGVIMPESDGVGTQDWIDSEEGAMVEEVLSAMEYWVKHAPENNLRFSYEINYRVPVKVEPLDRGGWTIEDKWAGQSLESLGFGGRNHFAQSYSYIALLRDRFHSDWGFIIFLLHGRKGQNFGSFLAYSYLGGPFNVNISANGALGTDKLDRVIAHETGHTFYTLDEYLASPHDCSARSGYLDVVNANKLDGGMTCELNVPCIMRGASASVGIEDLPPCIYTRGQVGWRDADADGIPDVLDTDPIIGSFAVDTEESAGVFAGDTLYSPTAAFAGRAVAVPLTNMNMFSEVSPRHVTIEPVSAQYRLNEGPWRDCRAVDGAFDGPSEAFSLVLDDVSPWQWHNVEVRAVTEHGNVTPDSLVGSITFFAAPPLSDKSVVHLAESNPARPPVSVTYAPVHPSGRNGATVPLLLAVYDAMGRRVAVLASGDFTTGRFYRAEWDGTNSNGDRMPAGIYMIGMSSEGRMSAEKVLVVP